MTRKSMLRRVDPYDDGRALVELDLGDPLVWPADFHDRSIGYSVSAGEELILVDLFRTSGDAVQKCDQALEDLRHLMLMTDPESADAFIAMDVLRRCLALRERMIEIRGSDVLVETEWMGEGKFTVRPTNPRKKKDQEVSPGPSQLEDVALDSVDESLVGVADYANV